MGKDEDEQLTKAITEELDDEDDDYDFSKGVHSPPLGPVGESRHLGRSTCHAIRGRGDLSTRIP